ncbi:MAG: FliH/SctL family protein [Bryobacteraceae bacterium]
MSSKLYRSTDNAGAEPIRWKHIGGSPAGAPQLSPGLSRSANEEPPDAATKQEIAARVDEARRKALVEGESAGTKKASAKLAPAIEAFQNMVRQLSSQAQAHRVDAEEDMVKLSIAIARRVINRELTTDPEAILGLIKAAGSKLNGRELKRLRVSPSFFAAVATHRGVLDLPPGLGIESDESLPPDTVLFETTRGEVDASIQTQLAEIERGLTDIVRRQTR